MPKINWREKYEQTASRMALLEKSLDELKAKLKIVMAILKEE